MFNGRGVNCEVKIKMFFVLRQNLGLIIKKWFKLLDSRQKCEISIE